MKRKTKKPDPTIAKLGRELLASLAPKVESQIITCPDIKKIGFCTECHLPLYQFDKGEIRHIIPIPPRCSIRESESTEPIKAKPEAPNLNKGILTWKGPRK